MNTIKSFLFVCLIYLLLNLINTPAQDNDIEIKNSTGFTAKNVATGVWLIDDHRNDNCYLVIGSKKAMLIDTGIGGADLKSLVESITDLPLIVVNTHGHYDHTGGNFQFSSIYMHPDDIEAAKHTRTKEFRDNSLKNLAGNPDYDTSAIIKCENFQIAEFISIEEGYSFDLGDRKLEVIEVPGHTPGCICLLDKENKLLFSGDNNCQHIWLFMNNSTTVETYMKSLEKLITYSEYFDTILPGHLEPMGKDYLDEVHTCVQNILDGNCDPQPYQSFGDNVKCCVYKRANVVFNPDHLF